MTQYSTFMSLLLDIMSRSAVTYRLIDNIDTKRVLIYAPSIGTHPIEFLFDKDGKWINIATYQLSEV